MIDNPLKLCGNPFSPFNIDFAKGFRKPFENGNWRSIIWWALTACQTSKERFSEVLFDHSQQWSNRLSRCTPNDDYDYTKYHGISQERLILILIVYTNNSCLLWYTYLKIPIQNVSPQVTYGWFIRYPYCQYYVHNFRNTAGGDETGEIVGAKHYLWLGRFRQEELREDTVGIGMFLKLAIHMVHLYWSIWYPPITKMIKIFNVVTSTDMFIYICIYIYIYIFIYTHSFGGNWDMPIWILITIIASPHDYGSQLHVFCNFTYKLESGLFSHHFCRGRGLLGF